MLSVYGPVPSWRLGRSLGIDVICGEKTCTFDCIYCQLGRTKNKTKKLQRFVETAKIESELEKALETAEADVITFSGSGEPTLAENLAEATETVRAKTDLPIAILTNSSLLYLESVRKSLSELDVVVAKLDAPNEEVFQKINKPVEGINFQQTLEGIKKMKKEFTGKKFCLQSMFVESNKRYAAEIASLAAEIEPDEVQIDTPIRKCPVKALPKKEIDEIKKGFSGLNVVSVYDAEKPVVKILDLVETKLRRPEL